jgi:hypothetical protein
MHYIKSIIQNQDRIFFKKSDKQSSGSIVKTIQENCFLYKILHHFK